MKIFNLFKRKKINRVKIPHDKALKTLIFYDDMSVKEKKVYELKKLFPKNTLVHYDGICQDSHNNFYDVYTLAGWAKN